MKEISLKRFVLINLVVLLVLLLSSGYVTADEHTTDDDHEHFHQSPDEVEAPLSGSERDLMLMTAAQEFDVPVALLQAIGEAESGWVMRTGRPTPSGAWGVMGLKDTPNSQSLYEAANILDVDVHQVELDPLTNIRGAAAVLRMYAGDDVSSDNLLDWVQAVKYYSGLPNPTLHDGYAWQIYSALNISLPEPRSSRAVSGTADCIGYAGVDDFAPAHESNYDLEAERTPIDRVVIHIGEGTYWGGLGWFQNPSADVSAHYFVSLDGRVGQSVCEQDVAWHAGLWSFNQRSIGIEHEGWSNQTYFTDTVYRQTADLVRDITLRYQIPRDREHIVGHYQVKPPHRANCPGNTWNWDYFMALVGGNDHLLNVEGRLTYNAPFYGNLDTKNVEQVWLLDTRTYDGAMLFDMDRLDNNLSYQLFVKDEYGNVLASTKSSGTGQAYLRFTEPINGLMRVFIVPDEGRRGRYHLQVTRGDAFPVVMPETWQDSHTGNTRFDFSTADTPHYLIIESLTYGLEASWKLNPQGQDNIATGTTQNGYAIIPVNTAGDYRVRVTDPTIEGTYRIGLFSGTLDTSTQPLTVNGGFEMLDASGKFPSDWQAINLSKDKVKCNTGDKVFSYADDCSVKFKAGADENSKLKQKYKIDEGYTFGAGDTLTLSAMVRGVNVSAGAKLKVKVKYQDKNLPKTKLILTLPQGTFDYREFGDVIKIEHAPRLALVQIHNRMASGRFFVDDVALLWTKTGGSSVQTRTETTRSELTLPDAPDGFRK